MNKDDEMSNTFVAEVGQKSAIFNSESDNQVETLNDTVSFPEIKIDPPNDMPSVLQTDKSVLTEDEVEQKNNNDEEEFLEANKKKKSKKYKKRNPFITFLIIIICLALGAFGSYYYFEVYSSTEENEIQNQKVNDNSTKKPEISKEEILPNSIFITELIDRYMISEEAANVPNYQALYSKDKVTVSDLNPDYLRYIVAQNANDSLFSTAVIKKEQMDEMSKKLFGNTLKLEDADIVYPFSQKITVMTYNSTDKTYIHTDAADHVGLGTGGYMLKVKNVKAYKENNKLYVNVSIALTDGNKVYKGYDGEKAVDELTDYTYETFDIDKDYAKLNQYKYTFDYDKTNNNYYLESIELFK